MFYIFLIKKFAMIIIKKTKAIEIEKKICNFAFIFQKLLI